MKLARYSYQGVTSVGVVFDDFIVDIPKNLSQAPASIKSILESGDRFLSNIDKLKEIEGSMRVPLSEVFLESPIPDPQKYLAIGMNYQDHADEVKEKGLPVPESGSTPLLRTFLKRGTMCQRSVHVQTQKI